MKRRLLTKNQTSLLQSILELLKSKTDHPMLITDFLNGCLCQSIINSLSERISVAHISQDKELTLAKLRKEMKVYQGEVLSNGLPYKAIVAVKNKNELKRLLGVTRVSNSTWQQSLKPVHLEIAIKEPGKFFGCPEPKRGRPNQDSYIVLKNVSFININNTL